MSKYDLKPEIKIREFSHAWKGYKNIVDVLKDKVNKLNKRAVVAIECYPGVRLDELEKNLIDKFNKVNIVCADDYTYDTETISKIIERNITEDRVFGIMSHFTIDEFFPKFELNQVKTKISNYDGLTIVYGTGTVTIAEEPDLLVYADLARWEIQGRYRAGMSNWKVSNSSEDSLRKFKRGYFFEWRLADRIKQSIFDKIDFLLDTNIENQPKMVSGIDYKNALKQAVSQPFRLVPYFDSSIWGGQWMKENFNLDPKVENYGWAFDGVPEENSILLRFGEIVIEIPSINLVYRHPDELLGKKVRSRFGKEFPIRFDYLDTVGGGNLSLQVHPLVEYINDKFGMAYTQNESYYIMDAKENSTIYLGVKEGIDKDEMISHLKKAEKGNYRFPDEKYINCFPVKKHDHYSIPAGTVHCGGPDTVVLEISATPYIFTFKLWDWERVGLDGIPRPVHINHGAENIQTSYDTKWVKENLANQFETLIDEENYMLEKTGLHELEFIETRRHWFSESVLVKTHDSVNMLNLVEGEEIIVESIDGSFEPYEIHYGETFIVPEQLKAYKLVSKSGNNKKVGVLQAFVKNL